MTSIEQRSQRVAAGSRRKRDLAAVDATGPAERSRENYERWLAWAERALPAEHAPFAASAAMTIKARGGRPTAENVRARLVEQGRDHRSLERLA